MTTIINASTSAGLIQTADTSGILQLQTANTAAVTIDASQNVGVGTASPSFKVQVTAPVVNAGVSVGQLITNAGTGNAGAAIGLGYNTGNGYYAQVAGVYDGTGSAFTVSTSALGVAATERMRIDSSGNVGIGTASPATKLNVNGGRADFYAGSNSFSIGVAYNSSSGNYYIGATTGASPSLVFSDSTATERMRIDSSGQLLIGTTSSGSSIPNGICIGVPSGASAINIGHPNATPSGYNYVTFAYNAGQIGSITQNGTTGVLYNLTSDYRLKNNPVALTGASEFIMALQPKSWDWWDGSGKGVGFIAHEFMEVAKYSGSGKKDEVETVDDVDAEGKVIGTKEVPKYQSIQPSSSEVMANLVSLVQEQQALITDLTTRLTALEGAK